jgi:hypothetical protein
MQRVKTSGAIIRALLTSATVVASLITTLSVQSGAQETKNPTDLSTLPPVESIGPKTNIRAFLRPDVPQVLHVAAVRRAWRIDPAIRDFREMAENDWDFTAVGGVLGFGALDPDFDAQGMVEQMLSEPTLTVAERSRQPSTTQTARAGFWSGFFSLAR